MKHPARLHPRNRHQGRYDLPRLTAASPELAAFLTTTPLGERSVDFGNPVAVRALNRAVLKADYGIAHWSIPEGYLCPPVPGRADYVHGLADLLADDNDGVIPRGSHVRVLDIGTGASCIYPLLGHREYGWRFVGAEVDAGALKSARAIVQANAGLAEVIEVRAQSDRGRLFDGIVNADDRFDLTLCNPPFHASPDEAARVSRRKVRNLGVPRAPLNFGGQASELWCTGGEPSFLRRMIRESTGHASQVLWFSSLVSQSAHLADIRRHLQKAGAKDVREVPMAQGNKLSRFVAWTFQDAAQRASWRALHWRSRTTP